MIRLNGYAKTKPFLSTCYGDPYATEVPPCCEAATKKLTFSTTSVLLLLDVGAYHCPCPEEQFLGGKKTPEGGTVCNEPEGKYYTVPTCVR